MIGRHEHGSKEGEIGERDQKDTRKDRNQKFRTAP
jgi:hypothetical protein